jgi:hypothetical protein
VESIHDVRRVLFHTVHDLFRLEKRLVEAGMEVKPMATPREFSSDCGSALRFPLPQQAQVEKAILELGLEVQAIHAWEN